METSKVIILDKQEKPQPKGLVLTPEEKKRLVDFFAVLIEIDQKNKRKEVIKNEQKSVC